jgi:hypothetical protein
MSDKITECPNTNCRSPITAKTIDDLGRCVHCGLDYSAGGLEKSEVASLRTALTESRREVEVEHAAALVEAREADRLRAENATLRQEVERQKDLRNTDRVDWQGAVDSLRRQVEEQADTIKKMGDCLEARDKVVEEQAASLEKVTRSWEEQAGKLAEVLKNEWDLRLRAEKFQTAKEQAESSLAAMTRERDEALAVVAEYKFGQTASARILRERDAAQSRAEAYREALVKAKDGYLAVISTADRYAKELGGKAPATQNFVREGLKALNAALAAPSEPKEGCCLFTYTDSEGEQWCETHDRVASKCAVAPTPSAGEEPWKCPGLASGGPGKCSREKPCFYCNPKFQARRP